MSEEEQTTFEKQYIADEGLFQKLLLLEDDLIDAFVLNDLADRQREKFEKVILASEHLQQKVEFARVLVALAPKVYLAPPSSSAESKKDQ